MLSRWMTQVPRPQWTPPAKTRSTSGDAASDVPRAVPGHPVETLAIVPRDLAGEAGGRPVAPVRVPLGRGAANAGDKAGPHPHGRADVPIVPVPARVGRTRQTEPQPAPRQPVHRQPK